MCPPLKPGRVFWDQALITCPSKALEAENRSGEVTWASWTEYDYKDDKEVVHQDDAEQKTDK